MKKIICVLIAFLLLILTSCSCSNKVNYHNSLDEYKKEVKRSAHLPEPYGFSWEGLDWPNVFLPSATFLEDFDYITGGYVLREEDSIIPVKDKYNADIVILYLEYGEVDYDSAKEFTIDNIFQYGDVYSYNRYHFYRNNNYIKKYYDPKYPQDFIYQCNWVGYNDDKQIIMFLSHYIKDETIETIKEDFQKNFGLFLETYYGEFYDFNS